MRLFQPAGTVTRGPGKLLETIGIFLMLVALLISSRAVAEESAGSIQLAQAEELQEYGGPAAPEGTETKTVNGRELLPREDQPLWEAGIGGFARVGPAYPASESYQTNIFPLPLAIYRGRFVRVGDDRDKPVKTRIFRADRIKVDIDFGLNLPADSDEVDARTDMPDLDLLAEVGPELELQFKENLPGDYFLSLQLRGAFSFGSVVPDWQGVIFSTEFKNQLPIGNRGTELLTRITPEWASGRYMGYFYTVDPQFATANREAFEASGGYLGTTVSLSLKHEFTDKFQIRAGLRGGFWGGARNRTSPLYTAETTGTVYLAFIWKFWESERRATDLNALLPKFD